MTNKDKSPKEKRDESRKKYNEKKPHMVNYCAKKHYWKTWFDEDFIKSLYEKHGDKTFDILKQKKKEQKEQIKENMKEQQKKESAKLLLKSLKAISVN